MNWWTLQMVLVIGDLGIKNTYKCPVIVDQVAGDDPAGRLEVYSVGRHLKRQHPHRAYGYRAQPIFADFVNAELQQMTVYV